MVSHTRDEMQVISRRKAIDIIAEALVQTKDLVHPFSTIHERALRIADCIEAQSATDKLALLSLLSISSPVTSPSPSRHTGDNGSAELRGI